MLIKHLLGKLMLTCVSSSEKLPLHGETNVQATYYFVKMTKHILVVQISNLTCRLKMKAELRDGKKV